MSEASDLWDRVCADDCVVLFAEPEDIEKEFRFKSRLSSYKHGRTPIDSNSPPFRGCGSSR